MINIGDIAVHFKTKQRLQLMIDKVGKTETIKRLSWLHGDEDLVKIETLTDNFLSGDYVDDRGVKEGMFFWGDL